MDDPSEGVERRLRDALELIAMRAGTKERFDGAWAARVALEAIGLAPELPSDKRRGPTRP